MRTETKIVIVGACLLGVLAATSVHFRSSQSSVRPGQEPGQVPPAKPDVNILPPNRRAVVQAGSLKLVPNGYFNAEGGQFFYDRGEFHVLSQVPRVNEDGKFELEPESDLAPLWKGEEYYSDIYELLDGHWVQKGNRGFYQPTKSESDLPWLEWGDCDRSDELNLTPRYGEYAGLMDSDAKMKYVSEIGGEFPHTIIVYSSTPDKGAYYNLRVALFVPVNSHPQLIGDKPATEYGYFCGAHTVETKLATGQAATDHLFFFEEDSADSNYIGVHSFLVSDRTAEEQKKTADSPANSLLSGSTAP